MFGYAIYYIIALLIYSTYPPAPDVTANLSQSGGLWVFFFLCFILITRQAFQKIEAQIPLWTFRRIDHEFHALLTRQSIIAIMLFAVDIYVLNIHGLVKHISVFQKIPTLEALFFLMVFIAHLVIVWHYAYLPYQKIYRTGMAKKEYIFSNIMFSVPILLPWFLISITADIIQALPFETPRRFLMSAEGQAVYFIFFLLILAVVGPALIQKFWQCRPLELPAIRYRIESMCQKAKMGFKDILIWPLFGGKMITAGIMGLVRRFRYILVTPALVELLEPHEIDAVIAHEIGHIKGKHLLFYLFFFVGYIVIVFSLTDLMLYMFVYFGAAYGFILNDPEMDSFFISLCFSFSTILIFLVYFRYIFGYFMRNFERQADIFAYLTIGSPFPLISTFEKISLSSGQSQDRPNWHHFSIRERIDYLIRCATDTQWIHRHNAKIKKSLLIYIIALTFLGWMGVSIHYGEARENIQTKMIKKIIHTMLQKNPQNADLHQLLGDVYFSEKNYAEAAAAYERALTFNPDQVTALNNLAWLYATCEDSSYRRPQKALALAQRAAFLSHEAHVLDTLAEAYFVNKERDMAVLTAKKALSAATQNKTYYQDQLEKFEKAARFP